MKSHEFYLLAILAAVLNVVDPSWLLSLLAHLCGVCGILASFKAWRRENPGV